MDNDPLCNIVEAGTNRSLLSVSTDYVFAIGGVELLQVDSKTKQITFSDEFLNALSEQLSEYETREKTE